MSKKPEKKAPGKIEASACCGPALGETLSPKLFKALSDPARLAILARLAAQGGEATTVSEVASCCPTDISVVSRHLAQLREAGAVSAEKQGREVYYRACCSELASALRQIADALDACCLPSPGKRRSQGPAKEGSKS
ncbi:MAG: metalloregulator ArsR/SmtB family transcription factor [Bdellovibrionota bacterium]